MGRTVYKDRQGIIAFIIIGGRSLVIHIIRLLSPCNPYKKGVVIRIVKVPKEENNNKLKINSCNLCRTVKLAVNHSKEGNHFSCFRPVLGI